MIDSRVGLALSDGELDQLLRDGGFAEPGRLPIDQALRQLQCQLRAENGHRVVMNAICNNRLPRIYHHNHQVRSAGTLNEELAGDGQPDADRLVEYLHAALLCSPSARYQHDCGRQGGGGHDDDGGNRCRLLHQLIQAPAARLISPTAMDQLINVALTAADPIGRLPPSLEVLLPLAMDCQSLLGLGRVLVHCERSWTTLLRVVTTICARSPLLLERIWRASDPVGASLRCHVCTTLAWLADADAAYHMHTSLGWLADADAAGPVDDATEIQVKQRAQLAVLLLSANVALEHVPLETYARLAGYETRNATLVSSVTAGASRLLAFAVGRDAQLDKVPLAHVCRQHGYHINAQVLREFALHGDLVTFDRLAFEYGGLYGDQGQWQLHRDHCTLIGDAVRDAVDRLNVSLCLVVAQYAASWPQHILVDPATVGGHGGVDQ